MASDCHGARLMDGTACRVVEWDLDVAIRGADLDGVVALVPCQRAYAALMAFATPLPTLPTWSGSQPCVRIGREHGLLRAAATAWAQSGARGFRARSIDGPFMRAQRTTP